MANQATSDIVTQIVPEDTATNQKILASDNCDTTPVDTFLAMGDIYNIADTQAAAALAAIAPIVRTTGAVVAGNIAVFIDTTHIEDFGSTPGDIITGFVTVNGAPTAAHVAVWTDADTIEDGGVLPAAAGADTYIQFRDGTVFGGDADLTWNKTSNVMTVNGIVLSKPARRTVAGASATQLVTDQVLIINWATAAAVTILASDGTQPPLTVKNIGAGLVTITPTSGGFIDSATTKTLIQWDSVTLVDQATGQWIIV